MWDPFEVGLIAEINRVQRRAARFVISCHDKKYSVSSMLRVLGWESLQERRSNYRLNLLGKFEEGIFSDDVKHILRLPSYYGRRDHERKIKEIDGKTEYY